MHKTALSRREMSAFLLAAPAVLRGQQTSSQATRIKVDTERTIGQIDPKLYGNFLEHLGRCIEGGIFEEKSPLSDNAGYRRDVEKAVNDLHVSILRWPGGNFSSNYNWMDGIGPREERPRRLEMAWGTIEGNRFGTHEFLEYADRLKTDPYICCNLGTGTWDQAQQWIEYVTYDGDTAMTRLRRKNGRDKPWKVPYWGLGNEMDGPWQMGHRSAEDYGKFALEAAKLMHWTNRDAKLIAAGSSNFNPGADWTGWNRTVLSYLKEHINYLSLHMYVGNKENDYYNFQACTMELAHRIKVSEGLIEDALFGAPRANAFISPGTNGMSGIARGDRERGRRILEEHYNLEDALVVSSFLNTFVNHAHIVKIANMAQLVNVIAPIFTSDKGLYLQTIYYPLQLFATHCQGMALDLFVEGPTYSTKTQPKVPYLDTSAAYQEGTLVLNVTNRHQDSPQDAVIELEDKKFNGEFQVFEVNGPDIKAENDFGKTTVKTETKSVTASGGTLKYKFTPHSFTMLKGKVS